MPYRRFYLLASAVVAATLFINPLAAHAQPSCGLIENVISAAEDFSEFALAGDKPQARDSLAALLRFSEQIKPALPSAAAANLEAAITDAGTAFKAGDNPLAALAALKAYRVLVHALQARLTTTFDVAMLDYSGFRLHALTASAAVDWQAVSDTVAQSAAATHNTRRLLTGKTGLRDLIASIQQGLEAAVAAKSATWLESTAQIQLDSVDLLEQAINNPSPNACP